MCEATPGRPTGGDLCCPTCGARQEWSDTCRRCKCELILLRRVTDEVQASRRRCLWSLRCGRADEALLHARRSYTLCPDRAAARLLALCHLLQGNWTAAVTWAQIADP